MLAAQASLSASNHRKKLHDTPGPLGARGKYDVGALRHPSGHISIILEVRYTSDAEKGAAAAAPEPK